MVVSQPSVAVRTLLATLAGGSSRASRADITAFNVSEIVELLFRNAVTGAVLVRAA